MQKIGILTFHATVNYGATLQAYALHRQIQSLGFEAEFIDYRPLTAQWADFKYLFFKGRFLLNPLQIPQGSQKLIKTGQFVNARLPMGKPRYLSAKSLSVTAPQYSAIVCGSDEIWNIHSPIVGCDLSYFLDFVSGSNTDKISYAASFGSTVELEPPSLKEEVHGLLKDFDAIAVRDGNSMRLVEETGLSATKVLDPTFLVSYDDILKTPKRQAPFILVYGCLSAEEGAYVDRAAKQTGQDVIAIGCQQRNWEPAYNYINVSPEEWLGYFSAASYIFTKFYHGTIFSIIFRKPFNSFYNPGKAIKVKDLLGDLDLMDRLLPADLGTIKEPVLTQTIDWNLEQIHHLTEQSRAYLSRTLNQVKE